MQQPSINANNVYHTNELAFAFSHKGETPYYYSEETTRRMLLLVPKTAKGSLTCWEDAQEQLTFKANQEQLYAPVHASPQSPRARFFFFNFNLFQLLGHKWHFLDCGVKNTFQRSTGNLQCFICKMLILSFAHFSN